MKVVNPEASGHSRTRTLTERIKELGVGSAELIDAGFVMLLGLVAMAGFVPTFDTLHFLLVAAAGLALGIASAHVVVALRRPGAWLAVILPFWYFLLAPGIADGDEALGGVLPSLASLGTAADVAVNGWKELLTTLPPLPGDGRFLALPLILSLVSGAIGMLAARRTRSPGTALIGSVLLLVVVTVLGTRQVLAPIAQGLTLAGLAFAWLAVRHRRRRHLSGTGRSRPIGLLTGAGLLAAAVVLGGLVGGALPGAATPRWVLREDIQPPIEVKNMSSPLVGFRLYSSRNLKQLWDAPLLQVTGVPAASLLRLAVLDDYNGHTWGASGAAGDGFQRIGARLPEVPGGAPIPATVTFATDYERTRELGPWVPSLGVDTAISFSGPTLKTHASTLRYNLSTGQGLLTGGDRFRDGDVLNISTVPVPVGFDANSVPGGAPSVSAAAYAFLAPIEQKWAGGATSPAQQVIEVAKQLKTGYWSDGTGAGQADYLPGHSQGRLVSFVQGEQLVGSDEQYAATFALLCNQAGFPARVVFGAIVPEDGRVAGKNITAWVEVQTERGWQAIGPDVFIPDRSRTPDQMPQTRSRDKNATNVPPPNTTRNQANPADAPENDLTGTTVTNMWWSNLLKTLLLVLRVIGPPLLILAVIITAIVSAKMVRRRLRRTRGTPSRRVAGAWRDVFDQCRDLGMVLSSDGTRLEQAAAIGRVEVGRLAIAANTATFGVLDPTREQVDQLWTAASSTRKTLLASVGRWRRLVAHINVRSLLPERLAAAARPRLDRQVRAAGGPSGRRTLESGTAA